MTIQAIRETLERLSEFVEVPDDGSLPFHRVPEGALDDVLKQLDELEVQRAQAAVKLLEVALALTKDIKHSWQDLFDRCEAAQRQGASTRKGEGADPQAAVSDPGTN